MFTAAPGRSSSRCIQLDFIATRALNRLVRHRHLARPIALYHLCFDQRLLMSGMNDCTYTCTAYLHADGLCLYQQYSGMMVVQPLIRTRRHVTGIDRLAY
jgi:hypothetical protein